MDELFEELDDMTKLFKEVPPFFDDENYVKMINADKNDIDLGLANLPGHMAYYTSQAEHWSYVAERLEVYLERLEAEALNRIKDSASKVTDSLAKARTAIDKDVVAYKKRLALANYQTRLYKGAVRTLDAKSRTLPSRNAARNKEMGLGAGIHYPTTDTEQRSYTKEENRARLAEMLPKKS